MEGIKVMDKPPGEVDEVEAVADTQSKKELILSMVSLLYDKQSIDNIYRFVFYKFNQINHQ